MKKLFLFLFFLSNVLFSQNLTLYVLNVGQGDALLITDNKKSMMIDMGGTGKSTTQVIIDSLKSLKIDTLKYFVVSHYDADHIEGVIDVLNSGVKIDTVFDRGTDSSPTQIYTKYANAVSNFRYTMKINQEINFSEKVKIKCFVLNGKYSSIDSVKGVDENESSIGLLFNINNIIFYTAGDLHEKVEDKSINNLTKVDIFKVSHHGSKESTSDYFLSRINPQVALISVGNNNTHDHPTSETLSRLQNKTSIKAIYQTQQGIRSTAKSKVVGTIKVDFYDDYYIVGKDTFRLAMNGVKEIQDKPLNFNLKQNYPNPFNPKTTIEYSIEKPSNVILKVFNSLGQEVAELVNSRVQPGNYCVDWNGKNCSSGIYYYRFDVNGKSQIKSMVVIK